MINTTESVKSTENLVSGTIAISFARMNPPTVGHEKLVNCLKKMWWAHDRELFLSSSHDSKKNPLNFDYKYSLCKRAFQDIDLIVSKTQCKDVFAAIRLVCELGYAELDLVVGSDRFEELSYRVPLYNGTLYNFREVRVHEVPRDVEEISASKMRDAAINDDFDFFEAGLPTKIRPISLEIFEEVRKRCTRILEKT